MSASTKSQSAASGSSVEADLVHRRWLDPVPGLRPFEDRAVLDGIGGQATVDQLVDEFYARVEADGSVENTRLPVEAWFEGNHFVYIRQFPKELVKVEVDPDRNFPDVRRQNNVWTKSETTSVRP